MLQRKRLPQRWPDFGTGPARGVKVGRVPPVANHHKVLALLKRWCCGGCRVQPCCCPCCRSCCSCSCCCSSRGCLSVKGRGRCKEGRQTELAGWYAVAVGQHAELGWRAHKGEIRPAACTRQAGVYCIVHAALPLGIQQSWRELRQAGCQPPSCMQLTTLSPSSVWPPGTPVDGSQLSQALWRGGIRPGGQHIAQWRARLCCPLPRSTQSVKILHVENAQCRGGQLPNPEAGQGSEGRWDGLRLAMKHCLGSMLEGLASEGSGGFSRSICSSTPAAGPSTHQGGFNHPCAGPTWQPPAHLKASSA